MIRILGIITAALTLTACLGSGPTREDAFYRLNRLPSPPGMDTPLQGTVLVSAITSRGFTGGRNIVFWDVAKPQTVQRYTYHFWVEPPAVLIQDALAQALRDARLAEHVVTPTQRVRANYIVSGALLRMEHRLEPGNPHVLIEMELSLLKTDNRDLVTLKRYLLKGPAKDNQIGSAVTAFEKTLTRLVAEYLEDIKGSIE